MNALVLQSINVKVVPSSNAKSTKFYLKTDIYINRYLLSKIAKEKRYAWLIIGNKLVKVDIGTSRNKLSFIVKQPIELEEWAEYKFPCLLPKELKRILGKDPETRVLGYY